MENDSFSFALLDSGKYFALMDGSTEIDFAYGSFSIALVNYDYQILKKGLYRLLHQFFDNSFNAYKFDEFKEYLYAKIQSYLSFSSKPYLRVEQIGMITELIVLDILHRIAAEHFEITNIEKCIPTIFTSQEIQNIVKNTLQRNSTNLEPLMQITETFEINSQLVNLEVTSYFLYTVSDYLLLDLKMFLERSDKIIKKCECCQRLFFPSRKSEKYCQLPRLEHRKTCKKIMHIMPNDEFVKARNKARDKQHKQIRYYENKEKYDKRFLLNLYSDWSKECKEKFIECKRLEDIESFKKWIEKTKFTSDTIEDKWKTYIE